MKLIHPTTNERIFDIDQMFFSRTDERGVIEYGNDVFVRISGYAGADLVGKPHNIIRHPDMPKVVFKLFWDVIKAGKPIAAYVKNMAATGDYYWVVAVAFPVEGGYLSIRIKPCSQIFSKIPKLYKTLLEVETTSGVVAAGELLQKTLLELGFDSYEKFMIQMLFEELKEKDKILGQLRLEKKNQESLLESPNNSQLIINEIESVASQASATFVTLFKMIDTFTKSGDFFKGKVTELLNEFNDLALISLNLRVLASNFGEKGLALGIISERFQSVSSEIEIQLNSFSKIINSILSIMSTCIFNIASVKIQTDMVGFFVRESIDKLSDGKIPISQAFSGLDSNAKIFSKLCSESSASAVGILTNLSENLDYLSQSSVEIKKYINGLDVIEKMGRIEAGRTNGMLDAIKDHLEQLTSFNEILRKSMIEVSNSHSTISDTATVMVIKIEEVKGGLDKIFSLANELREK